MTKLTKEMALAGIIGFYGRSRFSGEERGQRANKMLFDGGYVVIEAKPGDAVIEAMARALFQRAVERDVVDDEPEEWEALRSEFEADARKAFSAMVKHAKGEG